MGIVSAVAVPHPPLIVPTVGRGQEERIRATIDAYVQAARAVVESQPDCLVVTSPHAPLFRDGFHVTTDAALAGSMARFNAPRERMTASCDVEMARMILQSAGDANMPAVGSERYRDDMDHGTYVPLYFIRAACKAAGIADIRGVAAADGDLPIPIVRIGLSGLSPQMHRALGHVIAQAADALGRRVAFVASGDLSHKLLADGPYGFAPEGPVFDEAIGKIFASGNLEGLFEFDEAFCEAAAECGLRSFQIMAGALDGLDFDCDLLSNEGPFGVGYGVAIVRVISKDPDGNHGASTAGCERANGDPASGETFATTKYPEEISDGNANESGSDEPADHEIEANTASKVPSSAPEPKADTVSETEVDHYIALARLSVETYVTTGRPAALPLDVPAELLNQRAGAFVSLHEHGELRGCIGTISATQGNVAEEILANGISACSRDPRFDPVRPDELDYLEYSVDVLGDAEPISSPAELDVKRYGVIVTKGWKRGLLLPNLDGVDTVACQLEIAKRKAGIHPADDDVHLERFEVVRHTRGGESRIK